MNRMYQMDKRENYEEKVVYDRVLFCRKENVGELVNNMRLYIEIYIYMNFDKDLKFNLRKKFTKYRMNQ